MIIAFIPARGGSKSIPLKNIKDFCGKPLIYWSLQALENSSQVDKIIVATDSKLITEVVQAIGFPKAEVYQRDPKNAQDTSSTEDVILEFLDNYVLSDNDIFLLVQATSPLVNESDFEKAINLYKDSRADSLLSCVRIRNFFWNKNGRPINYNYHNRPRRQDFEGTFQENGSFYINRVKNIKKFRNRLSGRIVIYKMPEFTRYELDDPDDWLICEALMKKHGLNTCKRVGQAIKMLITDVDGVLTDAGMYYSENGDELKKFSTYDGKAFELLRNAGIKTGIITSENQELTKRRAEKIKVDFIFQGQENKLKVIKEVCAKEGITLDEVAYIGDDLNDMELLTNVGLAACPDNAIIQVKSIDGIKCLIKRGGEGAVREFCDHILLHNTETEAD